MTPKELGIRTELIFHKYNGVIEDRGDHLFIETPSNPTFHWGNLLYFSKPPRAGDTQRWMKLFKQSFAHSPEVKHILFCWDGGFEGDEVNIMRRTGFDLPNNVVLATERLNKPADTTTPYDIHEVKTDAEWNQVVESQVACRDEIYKEAEYRVFKEAQMKNRRDMAEAGHGRWFAAFDGDKVIADMGIYWDGDVARYQSVGTHPDYRNKGLCKKLIYTAGQCAFAAQAKTLVIIADNDYHAANIYRSSGFVEREFSGSAQWHPGLPALKL